MGGHVRRHQGAQRSWRERPEGRRVGDEGVVRLNGAVACSGVRRLDVGRGRRRGGRGGEALRGARLARSPYLGRAPAGACVQEMLYLKGVGTGLADGVVVDRGDDSVKFLANGDRRKRRPTSADHAVVRDDIGVVDACGENDVRSGVRLRSPRPVGETAVNVEVDLNGAAVRAGNLLMVVLAVAEPEGVQDGARTAGGRGRVACEVHVVVEREDWATKRNGTWGDTGARRERLNRHVDVVAEDVRACNGAAYCGIRRKRGRGEPTWRGAERVIGRRGRPGPVGKWGAPVLLQPLEPRGEQGELGNGVGLCRRGRRRGRA